MDLKLSAEELTLKEQAREFAQSVAKPRAAQIDREEQYPWDIVRALGDAKFLGMTIPAVYGGQDKSFLEAALVIEEIARFCAVSARIVVETNMGAISAVMACDSEQQKSLAADLVLSGDKPAICLTEPDAGSDAASMTTVARRRGDQFVINGKKHWITGAAVSRRFSRVCSAKTAKNSALAGFWLSATKLRASS